MAKHRADDGPDNERNATQDKDRHYFTRDTFWEGVTASTFSTALVGLFALLASFRSGLFTSEAATNAAFSLGAAFVVILIALLWKPVHRYLRRGARYNWDQFISNIKAAFDDGITRDPDESSVVTAKTLFIVPILAIASIFVVSWFQQK